jgi:translation elongation factor EF-G
VANLLILTVKSKMAQVTGSLISAVRDACRNGLLDWSPRIMLAMYSCDIQASSEHEAKSCSHERGST